MTIRVPKRVVVLALVAAFLLMRAAGAAPLDQSDMVDFLTQSLCLDSSGKPTSQVPIIDSCARMRPQRGSDRAVYRKHDWPNAPHPSALAFTTSDSVLRGGPETPVVEQTFLFADSRTGAFERSYLPGDHTGAQVVLLRDGWATIPVTEDAHGITWFIGDRCRRSLRGAKMSWLLFNQAVPTGRWGSVVTSFAGGHSASDCPSRFNQSYTRFRRERIEFPFRLVAGSSVTTTTRSLDTIVTDHFGGAAANPADNAHLERFYFARHLGWVRWERWENTSRPFARAHAATEIESAKALSASGRCPTVDYSTSPGPGWQQVDCRMWTTIAKLGKPWTVNDYHWRVIDEADWR